MKYALALALVVAGCAGSLRSQSRTISNTAADVISQAARTQLSLYCNESMHAIGRTGDLTSDGHCHETGARMGTAASSDELSALALVRSHWAPVFTAAELVIERHNVIVGLLSATNNVTDGQILAALGDLTQAHESLRQAAIAAGMAPPPQLELQ